MEELFNNCVKSLETYIMFKITEEVARIRPALEKKGIAPISLTLGAPTQAPPKYIIDKLKEALDIEKIHTYSSPRGEKYYLEAIAKRMKNRLMLIWIHLAKFFLLSELKKVWQIL